MWYRRYIQLSPLGLSVDGDSAVLTPVGLFVMESDIGLVALAVTLLIVAEVFGCDTVKAHHDGLQLPMIAVKVMHAKGAVRATLGRQLKEVEFIQFSDAHIDGQFVGTLHRIT